MPMPTAQEEDGKLEVDSVELTGASLPVEKQMTPPTGADLPWHRTFDACCSLGPPSWRARVAVVTAVGADTKGAARRTKLASGATPTNRAAAPAQPASPTGHPPEHGRRRVVGAMGLLSRMRVA